MFWDAFVSHATEDKDTVASPIAAFLVARGLRVWYDEFELRLGDSIRESIDNGLSNSHLGIVILSEHFFRKRWPRAELNALTAIGKRVIPVWHNLSASDVAGFSPLLADRVAVKTDAGLENAARQIADLFPDVVPSDGDLKRNVDRLTHLREMLRGPDPMGRLNAAWALADEGTRAKSACDDLCKVLLTDKWMIAQAAAATLGEIGFPSEAVIESLCEALQSDSWMVRRVAAWSLGQLGASAKKAKARLALASDDDHEEVRQAARDALRSISTTGTVLLHISRQKTDGHAELEENLSARIRELIEAVIEGMNEYDFPARSNNGLFAAIELGRLGPRAQTALPALCQSLAGRNRRLKERAAWAIGQMGSYSQMAVPFLVQELQRNDYWFRHVAARTLGEIGRSASAAIPVLQEALTREDCNDIFRDEINIALAKIQL